MKNHMSLVQKLALGVSTFSMLGAVALGAQTFTQPKKEITGVTNIFGYNGETYGVWPGRNKVTSEAGKDYFLKGNNWVSTTGEIMPIEFNKELNNSELALMQFPKENNIRPVGYFEYLHPVSKKTNTITILSDGRAILGNKGTYDINFKEGVILVNPKTQMSSEFSKEYYNTLKEIISKQGMPSNWIFPPLTELERSNLLLQVVDYQDFLKGQGSNIISEKVVQPAIVQYDDTKIKSEFDKKVETVNNTYGPLLKQFDSLTKKIGGLEHAMIFDRFRIPSKSTQTTINNTTNNNTTNEFYIANHYDDSGLDERLKVVEGRPVYNPIEVQTSIEKTINQAVTQTFNSLTENYNLTLKNPNNAQTTQAQSTSTSGINSGGQPTASGNESVKPNPLPVEEQKQPTSVNPNNADIIGGYGSTSNGGIYGGTESFGALQPTTANKTTICPITTGDPSSAKKENKGWYISGRAGVFEENGAITGKLGIDGGYQFNNQTSLSLGARLGLLHPERLVEHYQGAVGASGRYAEGTVTNQDRTSIEGVLRFTYKPVNIELFAGTELGNTKTNEKIMRAGKVLAENNNSQAYAAFKYGISTGVMFPVGRNMELGIMGSYDNIDNFSVGANVGFKLDVEPNKQ